MTPYIILLVITTLFAYFANRQFDKSHKLSLLFVIGIIIVYTIIGGLRDFGVGTDTNVYIKEYFDTAKSMISIKDFLSIQSMDKGFLLLCWLSSCISSDSQVVLIVTELWIVSFTMYGAYMLKRDHNMNLWIFVFLYFFMFFGYSLNLMRQFCAMSLLFWGYAWLRKGNWKIYVLTQVIAYFFHTSSIVFILVPIVYFLSYVKNMRVRNLITIFALSLFLVLMSSFYYYLSVFGDMGIVSEVYADRYGKYSNYRATENSSILLLLNYISIFYFLYLANRNKKTSVSFKYILLTLYAFNFLFIQLSHITVYLDRLSYYINLIFLTYLVHSLEDKHIPTFLKITVISFTIFFCYRIFVNNGGAEIYPYTSKILGF